MTLMLFFCGVLRVVIPTAYVVLAMTAQHLASVLAVPFGIIILVVAIYDARDRRQRACVGGP